MTIRDKQLHFKRYDNCKPTVTKDVNHKVKTTYP